MDLNKNYLNLINPHKRKPRTKIACDHCRSQHIACDGNVVCSRCTKHNFICERTVIKKKTKPNNFEHIKKSERQSIQIQKIHNVISKPLLSQKKFKKTVESKIPMPISLQNSLCDELINVYMQEMILDFEELKMFIDNFIPHCEHFLD